MSVDEVIALLKAGVGEKVVLAQVRATGARPALTVADILKLKTAGASDDLLAALVDPAPAGSIPQAAHQFRVYREVNALGEEVLHITNLAEAGRRIGGEVERRDQGNATRTGRPSSYAVIVTNARSSFFGRRKPISRISPVLSLPVYGNCGCVNALTSWRGRSPRKL